MDTIQARGADHAEEKPGTPCPRYGDAMERREYLEGPLQVRYLPLSKLARAKRNPKGHALDVIDNSISRFGFINPIVVNDATGCIVAGHGRLETLQRAKAAGKPPPDRIVEKDGEWFVPTVSIAFATDAEAEAFLIADNQTVVLGGWDEKALAELLAEHAGNLRGTGFDESDVAELLGKLSRPTSQDPGAQIDKAGEFQKKWGTAAGQLWRIGSHRLWCGDSRNPPAELFPRKIRMVWTDPPYGVGYADKNKFLNKGDRGNRIQKEIANDHMSEADTENLFARALAAAVVHCIPGAACYATVPAGSLQACFIRAMGTGGFAFKHGLVWVKNQFVIGMSDYHYRHEPILYGWLETGPHYFVDDRTKDSVFEINKPAISDMHPTTKPLELVAQMIANSSRPGEVVYDPFSGSGTVLVACEQLRRVGCASEIDPGYVAVTLERLAGLGLTPKLSS